ncbi:MAG: MBOAT family protein [Bacteroidales bacterium]|jgi:D-alanyl-lipoteichoic acid acyltransferase DltB (MBOAT superfamily)|nr:MBOAT family protein [Bacteroidales bacterium]
MLFNSIDFAFFLPVVFTLYWLLSNKKLKLQNLLVVIASYVFYGWWDWRFLFLMFFSTIVDYSVGLGLMNQEKQKKRKLLLFISILTNLGLLGFFKYYNFFIENFCTAFTLLGMPIKNVHTLNIVLPLGISFYTFQTLSYSIDVYRRNLKPTKDFIAFAGFVSFFPQLVAGPIEKASHLLPQFLKKRSLDYSKASDGMRQILWGLFKKVVIADNCAVFVDNIFANNPTFNGSSLAAGAILFSIQVYCDFSGYSDIAIGTARLFGFELMQNFAFPFFSRNIAEFYRRWHISLFKWFKDYVYIPLGGNRCSKFKHIRNVFIVFIICGLWHGAGWTYLMWGVISSIYFLPLLLGRKKKKYTDIVAKDKVFPSIKEVISMFSTFCLFTFSCIFLRAENINQAFSYIKGLLSTSFFEKPGFGGGEKLREIIPIIIVFFIIEWIGRKNKYAIETFGLKWPRPLRWTFYTAIIIISMLLAGEGKQFVYFQF